MFHNYSYSIGKAYQSIDSLTDARKLQKSIVNGDKTACLYRDVNGFYIKKIYDDGTSKRIY